MNAWPRAILHLDMDAFFVSVERRNDPSLIGQPVIVGGGKDGNLKRGVVAACSYETRKFGIHSAMPLAQAVRLCPQVTVIPVGRSDYGAATAEVRDVLESFTDAVEMTSPDEAYLDLEGTLRLHGPPLVAAHKLRAAIVKKVALPCSVGLSTSKTCAKIASKLSKPQGLFAILPGGEQAILRPLPLRRMPGLGPKTAERLERDGIRTLGDLIDAGADRLESMLGDHGRSLHRRARGECGSVVESSREAVQVSTESTFADDIADLERIETILTKMAMRVGRRLRKRELWAGTLTLKLRYPDFTTLTRQMPMDPPTCDDTELYHTARALLLKHWDRSRPLRLFGISASNLTDTLQDDLFDRGAHERKQRVLETMDRLRERTGGDRLIWGTALEKLKSEGRSGPKR